jgi:hypothetical protein
LDAAFARIGHQRRNQRRQQMILHFLHQILEFAWTKPLGQGNKALQSTKRDASCFDVYLFVFMVSRKIWYDLWWCVDKNKSDFERKNEGWLSK